MFQVTSPGSYVYIQLIFGVHGELKIVQLVYVTLCVGGSKQIFVLQ